MSSIEQSIAAVRRVHERLGSHEFAKISGVPYTTIRDASARDFAGKPVETLIKLANAAEQIEADEAVAEGAQDRAA